MAVFLEKIVSKILSVLIIVFLIFIVLLFSSVSFVSKLILSFLLIIIFITSLYLLKGSLYFFNKNFLVVFFAILVFLFYLFLNTYFISKIPFESKTELLNFCFYTVTFFVFYTVLELKSLYNELIISFLIVQTFLFLSYIFGGEKLLNFFVYNPNIIAGYCLLSWLFSFFYLYKREQKYQKIVFITFLVSSIFLIFLKSYSSLLIVVACLVLVFLKNKFLKWFVIFSLFLTVSMLNFNSGVDRIAWIVVGLKIWIKHFFFGVGIGNFKFYYSQYLVNTWLSPSIATIFVHNYFVQLVSEIGVIGLSLFLFFVIYILKNSKNELLSYPVYGIIVQNFVDYVLYIPQNSIIFFIFLSLLVKETKNKDEIVEKKIVWLYFFCIILLFIYCIVSFIKMDRIVVLSNSRQKENFYKSVSLDKTYWFGWKQIAVSLVNEGKLEEAEKMFMNVIKTNPTDAESYFFLSVINFKLGNSSEGYKFLKQMLKVNPKIGYKYIRILRAELK
jgi:hypothetical protein